MMARRLHNGSEAGVRGTSVPFVAVPVSAILDWPDEDRQRLRLKLEGLFRDAFVRMPAVEVQEWVEDYFTPTAGELQRHALLLANESDQLIATSLLDQGPLAGAGRTLQGVYVINRVVASGYQRRGLGRSMAVEILVQFEPDVLMSTCTQPAPIYSWIRVVEREFAGEWEVFPRWERATPRFFPAEDHDWAVAVFRHLYGGVAKGDRNTVERAVASLSRRLVRRGVYTERYETHPWEKAGRRDLLAEALGAGLGDGILLVMLRKGVRAR